jgi:hypothetical protein
MGIKLDDNKRQYFRNFLVSSIKNDLFEDYLTVYPANCSKLLQHLLKYQES